MDYTTKKVICEREWGLTATKTISVIKAWQQLPEREIYLTNSYGQLNRPSVIDLLSISVEEGSEIEIKVEGKDDIASNILEVISSRIQYDDPSKWVDYNF
ncbi:HPr family phosphocarrier protein [Candidatus Woesearchaeota archaeon]|nr:HPr family phosphocarrier protein [Candidatus Woesearchaeota archaeon]